MGSVRSCSARRRPVYPLPSRRLGNRRRYCRPLERVQGELELRFEQVASVFRDLDIESIWSAAEEQERRVLVEELVEWVSVFPTILR